MPPTLKARERVSTDAMALAKKADNQVVVSDAVAGVLKLAPVEKVE